MTFLGLTNAADFKNGFIRMMFNLSRKERKALHNALSKKSASEYRRLDGFTITDAETGNQKVVTEFIRVFEQQELLTLLVAINDFQEQCMKQAIQYQETVSATAAAVAAPRKATPATTVCRDGIECTRDDCHFYHPDGKLADYIEKPVSKPKKEIKPCRHGKKCWRKDCWFAHPEGRDIDNDDGAASSSV